MQLVVTTICRSTQKYMYDNKIHSVENRIISISQPWIRPIVRGKLNAPVEFGVKLDVSVDSDGYARIEKTSFEAYNECICLKEAAERFKERTGHYPERILADQIYRTRDNRSFCKKTGFGCPVQSLADQKQSQQKQTKNWNIRITRTGSKLSASSVQTNVATGWARL